MLCRVNSKLRKLYATGSAEMLYVVTAAGTFMARIECVTEDALVLTDDTGNRAYLRLDSILGVYGMEFAGAPRRPV